MNFYSNNKIAHLRHHILSSSMNFHLWIFFTFALGYNCENDLCDLWSATPNAKRFFYPQSPQSWGRRFDFSTFFLSFLCRHSFIQCSHKLQRLLFLQDCKLCSICVCLRLTLRHPATVAVLIAGEVDLVAF